ncbi:MAG: ADP-glyceromanno-heptose 6-epimerase [Gemmatimonadaceae bacterium]|nr:ADP-glyceromanno-heptose 6-epimerase [Gemmatimonadaceae bacterium]
MSRHRLIVTGGAGFIGSATIWQLNKLGYDDIICVDALRSGDKWRNLVGLRITDALHKDEFLATLRRNSGAFQADTVIHFGACSATTERDADYLLANNTHYTSELCEWSLARDARFIYASSGATYGEAAGGFDDDPARLETLVPLNMYGFSKHLFDLQAARTGLLQQVVGLKFFNVFGPNEYHKGDMMSVVCKAHRQISESGELQLFQSHRSGIGDGEQQRDFVYVKDLTAVVAWLVAAPHVHGLFNLGTGRARTWNALAHAVFAAMQRTPQIRYVPMPESIRDRYQYFTQASMARLAAAGCPVKFTPLEDAVADYVTNYLARDEATLGVVGS